MSSFNSTGAFFNAIFRTRSNRGLDSVSSRTSVSLRICTAHGRGHSLPRIVRNKHPYSSTPSKRCTSAHGGCSPRPSSAGLVSSLDGPDVSGAAFSPRAADPYMMQITTTIIAPTPLIAVNFILFSRIVARLGPCYSRLTPRLYTRIFLTCDIIALIVQGGGGGIAASSHKIKTINLGGNIMLGGIIFQFVALTAYTALGANFLRHYASATPVRAQISGSERGVLDSRLRLMISALSFSTLVLFVRSIYRMAELADGWTGRIITTEVYFNVFDAGMVTLAIFTMNIAHPGMLLGSPEGRDEEEAHDDEADLERVAGIFGLIRLSKFQGQVLRQLPYCVRMYWRIIISKSLEATGWALSTAVWLVSKLCLHTTYPCKIHDWRHRAYSKFRYYYYCVSYHLQYRTMDVEQKGTEDRQKQRVDPGDEAAAAKLWAVYISEAEKYDKGLVESWKSDMQGMLIFAGLFSASLTAFLIESYKTLNVDSGDATVQLLARISRQLEASANGSTLPAPPSPPISFTPTTSSLICNALWFTSLGLSLACALIATLLDQWARDFLHRSEIRSAPLIRARIFSYLYYGLKRFNMHTVVEIIPLLLHASLFLFFSGLVAFLISVNIIMTIIAASILLAVAVTYSVLTLLPLRYFDCPYRTPLSGGFSRLFQSYRRIRAHAAGELNPLSDETMVETMARRAVAESAERTIRDGRALVWTVKSLSDDSELEPFVEGIPDVLWGSIAPDHTGPAAWGSGGPRSRQRYSYADHIRELVNNPDVRLCHRIENHLQSCDTGLLPPEARKRRLIASYKALWAIAILFHPKQFPTQLPLDFSRWKRFCTPEDDPGVLHYSVSAQALMEWNFVNAVDPRSLELLDYLAKCRTDIEQGHEPDKQPITSILKEVLLYNDYYVWRVLNSNLTVEVISEIETLINTIRCNTQFNYLERAARLDSEPYQWRETLDFISLPSFKFSKYEQPLGHTLNRIVQSQIQNLNTKNFVWIDTIICDLYCSYTPDGPTPIPAGIITYLNKRTAINDGFWFQCSGRLLSNFPITLSTLSSDKHSVVTEDQLLTALWRLTSSSSSFPLDMSAIYPSIYEALAKLGISTISISVTVLVKAQLYGSLGWHVTPENWLSRFNDPHLPTETTVAAQPDSVTADENNNMSPVETIVWNRILEGKVCILAEFMERCDSDPLPYNAVETMWHIDRYLHPSSVHDIYQNRFAHAVNKVFESSRSKEILPHVVNLAMFEAYTDETLFSGWGVFPPPWLTSQHARSIIKATFSAYADTLSKDMPTESAPLITSITTNYRTTGFSASRWTAAMYSRYQRE
ncbi:hypothetical protein MVEN_01860400 [Mycena venus]|uniref:DUF6535 domain-containing protein n=1 Tax=Mycena venus TaxID=2733690 RepID=A0A8H7CN00_9AGAR|nr:hypothetical protein MVEN_01860400 [Mycena venus]